MLPILSAILLSLVLGLLFWFCGNVLRKELKIINETNVLVSHLIDIAFGTSAFLIILNLTSTISKSFLIGLIASLVSIIGVICWQFKEFKIFYANLLKSITTNELFEKINKNTDKYFWILLGAVNFIYITAAISDTKLDRFGEGNTHVFNINQLISDIYPPRYAFLPTLSLRTHYGADILGAVLSKISNCHPEISLDLLTIIFLNLSFLAVYSLVLRFLNSNPANKYIVPFMVFIGWGPVTYLFTSIKGENVPNGILDKLFYLSQNTLADSATWSGNVFKWFFEPSSGIGVFFFLIGLYLLQRFFTNEEKLNSLIASGIFLSSFVIIDGGKLAILAIGTFLYLIFSYSPQASFNKFKNETELLQKIGIVLGITLVFGFIHGNCIKFDSSFLSLDEYFRFGQKSGFIDEKFNIFKSNTILVVAFGYGFYLAFKSKHEWLVFLLPYFIASLVIPVIITVPDSGAGKILMNANIIGAFSIPPVIEFGLKKFNLKDKKLIIFYCVLFICFSFSTVFFWAFGDKTKPMFSIDKGFVKYTGLQTFPAIQTIDEVKYREELAFTNYIKSKSARGEGIVTEPDFVEIFTKDTGLLSIAPPPNISGLPIRKEIVNQSFQDFRKSFLLDNKAWLSKNIQWIYMTPRMFRHYLPPQVRKTLLNAYLNKGAELALSNKKLDNLEDIKELYKVNPANLTNNISDNFSDLINNFLRGNSKNMPYYMRQIALCPYFGIYSAKSNDFDGDKISDIAFYDPLKKIWHIVYGKDGKETEIDLSSNILSTIKGNDVLIPVPSDYDADSKTDIALFNREDSSWYILRSSDSGTEPVKTWCGEWSESPLPADIDGDSKTDTACYNGRDKRWPAFLSTANTYHAEVLETTPVDITVYADIDGDKKADYVYYNPQQQVFRIRTVLIPGSSQENLKIFEFKMGTKSSRVVTGDYDGDGKTDIASWSATSGKWEIAFAKDILASVLEPTHQTIVLGKPGDIPMPGDYNGDGKTDVAIYHINNSELEIVFDNGTRKQINLSKYKNLIPASFIGI
jgi:hypothetical protein